MDRGQGRNAGIAPVRETCCTTTRDMGIVRGVHCVKLLTDLQGLQRSRFKKSQITKQSQDVPSKLRRFGRGYLLFVHLSYHHNSYTIRRNRQMGKSLNSFQLLSQ